MRGLSLTIILIVLLFPVEQGAAYPKDGPEMSAKDLETQAAEGNAEAQNNLGGLYAEGKGVPKDYVQARQWYEKAAAQGHALAQNNLAELYFAGLGVPQDLVRAYMWVNIAAVHLKGDEQKQAEANRDDVAQRMTPAQVTEAKRLSKECLSKKFKGC
ncbi:MAG: sel1 repeat family protein [Nitrospira sp.]|nr:sel1 repeat family protein [Nitrospira sp.]